MSTYRVKWKEIRLHYVDVEAEDKFEAIEVSKECDYEETASDESWYDGDYTVELLT